MSVAVPPSPGSVAAQTAANGLGVVDLSDVTAILLSMVKQAWTTSPIWPQLNKPAPNLSVTGASPDRLKDGVSVYLYHLAEDRASEFQWPFLPVQPGSGLLPIAYQPLALRLFYLVTASFEGATGWILEQQALSIVLRCFHEAPIIDATPASADNWRAYLTLESRTDDELSRLWQATATPLRTSAVYRASVLLLRPESDRPLSSQVRRLNAEVMPTEELP